jgi:response regulator RpfG family c-di-GMP phosphodiesterase
MIEAATPHGPVSSSETAGPGGVDQNGVNGLARNRPQILCVEDDFETLSLISEELRDRGFDVITANNGQEGFTAICRSQPDLVLCDINMPLMCGF